eukprot:TRINITY_DN4180_c0_g5_i1.p1 TRINITY_DN4180_c0_g5~~TRINITY_DN4180_c0_g5_i1.p1  ORF type:complete len:469 (-),score=103.51 TRINITY_DN4180_c0_g5_i1:61-1467(-)
MKTTVVFSTLLGVLFFVILCGGNETGAMTDLYTLIPGRYHDGVSLPTILENLPKNEAGRVLIEKIVGSLANQSNYYFLANETVYELLDNSMELLNYTTMTVDAMSNIWSSATLAYWAGEIKQLNTSATVAVPSPFTFPDDIFKVDVNASDWIPTLEYVGDNLWWGYPFSNITVDQVTINVVMSLVFNQLTDNIHLSPSDPKYFVVKYLGDSYTSIDSFLNALRSKENFEVSTLLEWHIAQFFGIYQNVSGSDDLLCAGDPVMVKTGIWNSDQTIEVTLPAAHSQWMFTINNSKISIELDWYQGDTSYGWYPSNLYKITGWSGRTVAWPISGDQAVYAAKLMSFTRDVFVAAAISNDLYDGGYGVTGVCDDSCAVIELVLFGKTLMYPLMIQKQFIVPEILRRIQLHDENEELYYSMLKAVNMLAQDWVGLNPTSVERAAASIVWAEGREPWECVVQAREILRAKGGQC